MQQLARHEETQKTTQGGGQLSDGAGGRAMEADGEGSDGKDQNREREDEEVSK